jgi:hypothetical protein
MDITDEHFRAIGRIAVQFGALEIVLDNFIGLMIGDIDLGEIVSRSIDSFEKRWHLMRSIFDRKYGGAELQERLAMLSKRVDAIKQHRNLVVHSWWIAQESTPELAFRILRKDRNVKNIIGFTVPELDGVADDIRRVISDFLQLSAEALGVE